MRWSAPPGLNKQVSNEADHSEDSRTPLPVNPGPSDTHAGPPAPSAPLRVPVSDLHSRTRIHPYPPLPHFTPSAFSAFLRVPCFSPLSASVVQIPETYIPPPAAQGEGKPSVLLQAFNCAAPSGRAARRS